MSKTISGVVHGNSIHLPSGHGIAEGQEVEVVVRPSNGGSDSDDEGLRRAAGALATVWTADDDRILDEIQADRNSDVRAELADWLQP